MLFVNACADNSGISAAPTVFIFQKIGIFLCRQALFKLFIDTKLSLRYAASTSENSVDHLLRKRKSRGFSLCLHIQKVQLPVHRRKRLSCILQFAEQPHCFKVLCNHAPIVKTLCCPAIVISFPKLKHILPSFVPDSPPVAQNHFGIVVIENTLDIFGTGGVIGIAFIESTNFLFRGFQVGRCAEDFTDGIVPAEKR